ncbi:RNA-binding S4 domain-containing protein [Zhongshania aliphaticivorans]|uniref:RNA-binding S4 domain-containing protein n=1 Tax=Zhongshania aliphaticivorans TaxID=1470434 RepID=UPI0012E5A7A3|nr:S4 domain-containing protein [Zhongshania aliphaticivorans]CAA0092196.1 Heat shock protein 15 [Zhongshania aliphaticivorans]
MAQIPPTSGIRLDKWLWAARFYKTRSLAKQAIEGGKVQYNGDRCKVSKEVQIGAELSLRVGFDTKVVTIIALSDQRRGAPEAALLYEETPESIEQRAQQAAERKALGSAFAHPERPNKKQRRQIHRFQRIVSDTD